MNVYFVGVLSVCVCLTSVIRDMENEREGATGNMKKKAVFRQGTQSKLKSNVN